MSNVEMKFRKIAFWFVAIVVCLVAFVYENSISQGGKNPDQCSRRSLNQFQEGIVQKGSEEQEEVQSVLEFYKPQEGRILQLDYVCSWGGPFNRMVETDTRCPWLTVRETKEIWTPLSSVV